MSQSRNRNSQRAERAIERFQEADRIDARARVNSGDGCDNTALFTRDLHTRLCGLTMAWTVRVQHARRSSRNV
jgi:hypothetical protein